VARMSSVPSRKSIALPTQEMANDDFISKAIPMTAHGYTTTKIISRTKSKLVKNTWLDLTLTPELL
jgi:hypothetical protein